MTLTSRKDPPDASPAIRNCRIKYQCEQRWADMKETGRPNVRLCATCQKEVHFVQNRTQLALAIQNGLCVSVPPDLFEPPQKPAVRPAPISPPEAERARPGGSAIGLVVTNPAATPVLREPVEIPAWLRKQMD